MKPGGVGFCHGRVDACADPCLDPSIYLYRDPYRDLYRDPYRDLYRDPFAAVEDSTHVDSTELPARAGGGAPGARPCTDFQITSHIPFAVVFVLSVCMRFFEMAVLVGLVLVFSLAYHLGWEERTAFSYIDNCTAFTLSMYGNVQLFFSPSPLILGINLTLGISSAAIFVLGYTRYGSRFYGWIHPIGLHILPGIWSGVVVVFQKPLLF